MSGKSTTNRRRGTVVTVPEGFSQRLRQLRKEKGWSQDQLVHQTRAVDQTRHQGISKRRIGAIERGETGNFEHRTLQMLSQAFGLSLDQLLNRVPPFIQFASPASPTTLFPSVVTELYEQIQERSRLIIIQGDSGVGKSRVAAALFEANLDNYQPYWFTGTTMADFEQTIAGLDLPVPSGSRQPLIVLDEDYRPPVRDTVFFLDLFQWALLPALTTECTLVCPLRRTTYQTLSQQGLLARATIIALDNYLDQLDDYQAWKLNRPLTAKERNWILKLLTDNEGQSQLNSFLVDKVCIPAIRYGRWQQFNPQNRQTVETIYQGIVHNQEPQLYQLTTAAHWVEETSVKPSLYLVTAVLNHQSSGRSVTVSQVRSMVWNHDLTRVEQRPFFEREPIWSNIYYSTCCFSHDLLKETMRTKVSIDEIGLEPVVKELVLLLSRSEIRLGELIESISAWLGLMGGQKRGFPAVSTAVAELANRLIDSGQASAIQVGRTVFAMCWFFCIEHLNDRSVMQEPALFQDLERVTESITRHLQPDDVVELCRMRPDGGSAYPLVDSFSGWLAGFALRSRQVESDNMYFWSMAERQIPALASMAERLTEDASTYHRLKIDSEKRCYIHLLAWAGKYRQAGDAILEMISSLPTNQRLSQQSIGWANQAVTAYWQAGSMDEIHNLFEFLAQSHETPILQRFFQRKLELICNSPPTSLFDFEWQCADLDSYRHNSEIMILQNPINQASFEVARHLDSLEIGYRLVESALFNDLTDLPSQGRFLILGHGYIGRHGDLIDGYLADEDAQPKPANRASRKASRFDWREFQVQHRNLVWIRGGWEQATLEGVRSWLLSDDCQQFLEG